MTKGESDLDVMAGPVYRRNLGNTIFTILFTMILITVVYSHTWYDNLNHSVLQLREDILVSFLLHSEARILNSHMYRRPHDSLL